MRACEHTHVRGSGDVVRGSRLPDAAALKLHEDGERLNKRKLSVFVLDGTDPAQIHIWEHKLIRSEGNATKCEHFELPCCWKALGEVTSTWLCI